MKINKLWELPVLSSQLEEELQIEISSMDITLSFKYSDEERPNLEIRAGIRFDSVLCHLHTSERFTKALLDAYDTLVEVDDSEWINELKNLNQRDFEFWKPKHYAIYFEGMGLYQFIARGFKVFTEEVK